MRATARSARHNPTPRLGGHPAEVHSEKHFIRRKKYRRQSSPWGYLRGHSPLDHEGGMGVQRDLGGRLASPRSLWCPPHRRPPLQGLRIFVEVLTPHPAFQATFPSKGRLESLSHPFGMPAPFHKGAFGNNDSFRRPADGVSPARRGPRGPGALNWPPRPPWNPLTPSESGAPAPDNPRGWVTAHHCSSIGMSCRIVSPRADGSGPRDWSQG